MIQVLENIPYCTYADANAVKKEYNQTRIKLINKYGNNIKLRVIPSTSNTLMIYNLQVYKYVS